ncbi:MAG: acyltransferase [Microthrixaceae bacterium]|nr:acyltransferase [Microthrixaceae bacterium]
MGQLSKRSVYLDALRAFALARVVLYHSTSAWEVTAFTAMPLMFFIAGSLYANSLENRPLRQVISSRYRRILIPYWVYVVAMVVLWAYLGVLGEMNPASWVSFAMPVLSLGGPKGPGEGTNLEMTWIALWYLQMHLILSLAGGWLRSRQLQHGRRYWIALVALTVLLLPVGIGGLTFWALCWSLGYLQHDGVLEEWLAIRWKRIAFATGPLGFALFFVFHHSVVPLAALGALLLGVFWLTLAMGLRPRIEPALQSRSWRLVMNWMSARSLTIYLWHMPIIYAILELGVPGHELWPVRFALTCALLVPVCMVVGWAEDLAARKPATIWPTLPLDPGATASRRSSIPGRFPGRISRLKAPGRP